MDADNFMHWLCNGRFEVPTAVKVHAYGACYYVAGWVVPVFRPVIVLSSSWLNSRTELAVLEDIALWAIAYPLPPTYAFIVHPHIIDVVGIPWRRIWILLGYPKRRDLLTQRRNVTPSKTGVLKVMYLRKRRSFRDFILLVPMFLTCL